MDMMDVKIITMRTLKKRWLQMFILSISLGCISALSVMAAGTIKDLSDLLIFKRMCFMFIVITLLGFLILFVAFLLLKIWERKKKNISHVDITAGKESTVQNNNAGKADNIK